MPNRPAPDPVAAQRLRLLFMQSRSASYAALVGATLCAVTFWTQTGGLAPWYWWAAVTLTAGLRLNTHRRFFTTDMRRFDERYWLRRNLRQGILVGVVWGTLPLVPLDGAPAYLREMQTLVPAFVLMAAITSYGIYLKQYTSLCISLGGTSIAAHLYTGGDEVIAEAVMFLLFLPIFILTAWRYGASLLDSMQAKSQSERLVRQLTGVNADLLHQNSALARQRDVIDQEEALAKHVFRQLTIGGDHRLPGIHAWNQPMGGLSGDLTQTAKGPNGQIYVFLGDFTGHGLPAALGALPASSVFLAMAAKGLVVDEIAVELNRKLGQLLPVGYFCCATLLELSADRSRIRIWNGGLPPVLIRRAGQPEYERITSHSLPLGVVGNDEFDSTARVRDLHPGDVLYAYTDGLTEAENIDGEMWGTERLETFLAQPGLPSPKMPSLIDAIMQHVSLAPPSDDISVVEIEASPAAMAEADAA